MAVAWYGHYSTIAAGLMCVTRPTSVRSPPPPLSPGPDGTPGDLQAEMPLFPAEVRSPNSWTVCPDTVDVRCSYICSPSVEYLWKLL